MRDSNDPDTISLNEIDDAKRKPPHFRTSGLKPARFTHFRIASNLRERLPDEIKEVISQKPRRRS